MGNNFCINISGGKKILVELYPEHAPISAANFAKLANEGFYNGLCFHRVIDGFMIQGGGFSIQDNQLCQKQATNIKGEFSLNKVNNPLKHTFGTLSMARAANYDSGSSQFFICSADCGFLDGQYAAFGRVTDESSLAVVKEISAVKTGKWMHFDDVPVEAVIIESIVEI